MANGFPYDGDPSLTIVNQDGDVVPPPEEVFLRRDLKVTNYNELRGDHPAFDPDDVVLEGIGIARQRLQGPDLLSPDTSGQAVPDSASPETSDEPEAPFEVTPRLIGGESYLCAIGPDGEILAKRGQGSVGSPELFDLVSGDAERALASRESKAE